MIITDGLENASCNYTRREVKLMVERQRDKYGWEFIFMGANIDAVGEAASMGIGEDRAVQYKNDGAGVALNYEVVSEAVSHIRVSADRIDGSWKRRIEADTKERGK